MTSTTQSDAIRVLVADDEAGAVDVLKALVSGDPSLHFIGAANDAERAIELAIQEQPDVVLLDVRMPSGGGFMSHARSSERCAPTKIIAISALEDAKTVNGMIGAGAHTYVTKGASADKILRTIHRAAEGRPPSHGAKPDLSQVSPAPPHDAPAPSVARAIIDGSVTAEFGAIVDIDTGRTVGLDVRPRLATLPYRSYDAWRAEAQAVGVLTDLELAALREAQQALPELPEQIFLVLDVSPHTASEARFARSIPKGIAPRIVLGVSPSVDGAGARINDVILAEKLEGVRTRGIRIATTDPGSGRSASDHLRTLAPDYVRLDEALTASVDGSLPNDPIVGEIVACADQIGAQVIAAGVASEEHLEGMRRLGIHLVQGSHVGESFQRSELPNRVEELRSLTPSVVP